MLGGSFITCSVVCVEVCACVLFMVVQLRAMQLDCVEDVIAIWPVQYCYTAILCTVTDSLERFGQTYGSFRKTKPCKWKNM